MDFNINIDINGIEKELLYSLLPDIKELSSPYLDETFKGNKVAFLYKDINKHITKIFAFMQQAQLKYLQL